MKAKLLTISLMVGLFMGCHDFLDVKPVGKLIPTEVEEFENILNNTYTVDWYYMDNNKGTLLASLGDNLQISENSANYNYTATHPNINRYAAYTFKLPYGNPEKPDYFWEWGTYRAVGLLNNVIDGVNDVKNEKTAKLAEELSAQARAARAWSYLTMAMIYGPVYDPAGANDTKTIPYRTAASPTEANPALSTTAEVFGLAKAVLNKIIILAEVHVHRTSANRTAWNHICWDLAIFSHLIHLQKHISGIVCLVMTSMRALYMKIIALGAELDAPPQMYGYSCQYRRDKEYNIRSCHYLLHLLWPRLQALLYLHATRMCPSGSLGCHKAPLCLSHHLPVSGIHPVSSEIHRQYLPAS